LLFRAPAETERNEKFSGRRIGERRRRRQKNDTKASTQAIPDHRHGGFDLCSQRLAGLFFTRLLLLKASQL